MEALATGSISFVGPHHHNNREALEFKGQSLNSFPHLNAVNEVQDEEMLTRAIYKTLEYKSQLKAAQKEIIKLVKRKTGASDKLLNWLEEI